MNRIKKSKAVNYSELLEGDDLIGALTGALQKLLRNPLLLLPSLASMAILFGLAYAFAGFMIDLLVNAVFLEIVPEAPLQALPYQFLGIYATQLLGLAVFMILGAILFTALNYWYAAYVETSLGGKASVGKACRETISGLGKIIAFVIFVLLVLFLFAIATWLFALVTLVVDWLGLLLMLLLALTGFYLCVKLAFAVQAMALEKVKVKQGLQNSWSFCVGKCWHVCLLLLILAVVSQAIVSIGAFEAFKGISLFSIP
jgi:membrane-anchored glycerophosphoryl diester phosphodiesterase (GDPDase)